MGTLLLALLQDGGERYELWRKPNGGLQWRLNKEKKNRCCSICSWKKKLIQKRGYWIGF
jgi:hypothetical protein